MILAANAQVSRLELHPVLSVTLEDSDFLGGRKDGQQVTIAGELRIPKARMTHSEDSLPPAVGAYWIKEEDYPVLLQLFDDGDKMPPSGKNG